jgi:hypothetical protein
MVQATHARNFNDPSLPELLNRRADGGVLAQRQGRPPVTGAGTPVAREQISVVISGRAIVETYTKRRLLHDLVIRHPHLAAAYASPYYSHLSYISASTLRASLRDCSALFSEAGWAWSTPFAVNRTRFASDALLADMSLKCTAFPIFTERLTSGTYVSLSLRCSLKPHSVAARESAALP